jgi:hypothetical protein
MQVFSFEDEFYPVITLAAPKPNPKENLGIPLDVPETLYLQWTQVLSDFTHIQTQLQDLYYATFRKPEP